MLFVFCKDSASREERKELARISFPRRRLFYEKIVQAERKTVQAERKMKFTSIFPRRRRFYARAKQTRLK
ncbi:MAG: hypothetical protein EGP67_03015 [Bacteroidales bacterium]|nr:hypothetical protein [Bacteroidales bacterium]